MIDPTEYEKGIEAMEGEAKRQFLSLLQPGGTIQIIKPERMTQCLRLEQGRKTSTHRGLNVFSL